MSRAFVALLLAVAVAACADNHHKFTHHMGAHRLQRGRHSIRRMGVIAHHERPPLTAEGFHPPGGRRHAAEAVERLHREYAGLPPVHTLNNLALVVWALLSAEDDFSAAIGEAVAAGWDTDCNGATVGGLFGLTGKLNVATVR